jgi:FtsP/CotA-like multicopper oxidase with cupredoxin domain
VKVAQLITNNINTGPQGDCDPTRPIFNIALVGHDEGDAATAPAKTETVRAAGPTAPNSPAYQRFGGLSTAPVVNTRVFQFSEVQPSQFFITEVLVNGVPTGQPRMLFDNNNPPAVTVKQGTVEKWIIQNVAQENHEFHMHQIHFLVQSQDNFEINGTPQAPGIDDQYLDMIDVPFWDNAKNPNGPVPQVELLMDFRGMDIGDFVYHCHILSHEDLGMMAIIRVVP